MKQTSMNLLVHCPEHSVHCPVCQKQFAVKFAKFGHSNYQLIACDQCPNLLAVSDLDPLIMYLEGKYGDKVQDLQAAISRAAMSCDCGGKFRVFDDRRRCPLCKATVKELQMSAQVPAMGPEMHPIPGKLLAPGKETWKNIDFLRSEIELAAREYESNPAMGGSPDPHHRWLSKEIFDLYFRKITPEKLKALAPDRSDILFFNNRLYHDHGGAVSPWWRFWDREVFYPEKCGVMYDVDQKTIHCSSCKESFPAKF